MLFPHELITYLNVLRYGPDEEDFQPQDVNSDFAQIVLNSYKNDTFVNLVKQVGSTQLADQAVLLLHLLTIRISHADWDVFVESVRTGIDLYNECHPEENHDS